MKTPAIVLASSSKYRHQLLGKLGLPFDWKAPEIDETPFGNESPEQLVLRLAKQKAETLANKYPKHLIIGSDQIAVFEGKIIGKPHNHKAATAQLENFSRREIHFITGLCLLNSETGRLQSKIDTYSVKFKELTPLQIENYLSREQPYDCAGSFKSEGLGICLFEKMEGKDPNTLIGLPLIELTQMLINEGIDPLCP